MANSLLASHSIAVDQWVPAQWNEYLNLLDAPDLAEVRSYFDSGLMRLEVSPLGALHGRENSVVSTLVALFATLRGLRMVELTNTTFRQLGIQDAQPDIAFYLGQGFKLPLRDNRPIDVTQFGAPQLVVEIASTTLNDDLGRKRLLYERFGNKEYWVVDVQAAQVFAFAIANGFSGQILDSQVLPGLAIATVEDALRRSQSEDDVTINRWLMEVFSHSDGNPEPI